MHTSCVGLMADFLVTSTSRLHAGDRVFIHAAAGGTGRMLVQTAKMNGATYVYVTMVARARQVLICIATGGEKLDVVYGMYSTVCVISAVVSHNLVDSVGSTHGENRSRLEL